MPKARKPVADYITFDQYQKMLDSEPDPMMRLIYRFHWAFLLRVSEIVGQSETDVNQILNYRKQREDRIKQIMKSPKLLSEYKLRHNGRLPKTNYKWTGPLPGIRPADILTVDEKRTGFKHALRVYRKHGKMELLPFADAKLYADVTRYIKEANIPQDKRIFPVYRQDVENAMQKHGFTVGEQTRIHPHGFRKGAGIHFRNKGGKIEVLQAVYSHEHLAQTLHYIGVDKAQAFREFAITQKVLNKK